MRYRPFSRTGMAVSAVSLKLDGSEDEHEAADWRDLIHAAFEEGVNAFEIVRPSPALLHGFAEGASAVKRPLIFVALRLSPGLEGQGVVDWVDETMEAANLDEINLLTVDVADIEGSHLLAAMRWLKDEHVTRQLGLAGPAELLAEQLANGVFDAMVTPFSLTSGWRDRNFLRQALEAHVGVIATDPCPASLMAQVEDDKRESKGGWFKRAEPLAGAGGYAFLKSTPGWTVEQLCLGYVLTEPALATVQLETTGGQHLAALADVTDRGLPSAVSAQIEMARFAAEHEAKARRRA